MADKGEGGSGPPLVLADIICEQPLRPINIKLTPYLPAGRLTWDLGHVSIHIEKEGHFTSHLEEGVGGSCTIHMEGRGHISSHFASL